jgi:iron complex transport system substrate-binding protein
MFRGTVEAGMDGRTLSGLRIWRRRRTRRAALALLAGLGLLGGMGPAAARTVTDSAGRMVEVPDRIARVFAAGPPASVLLYAVAPEMMIGWVRTPRPAERDFLQPQVRDLPETGRLTGRGDTLNLERLIAAKPDLIVDFGTITDTYRSLADRVQAQTGIPYILIDGRFSNTPAALRLVGEILGAPARGAALAAAAEAIFTRVDKVLAEVPPARRPRVYLARGTEGLESGTRGSINTEIIERVGAVNVAEGLREKGGLAAVSPEQVIAWAPDTIVALDPVFAATIAERPAWKPVPAVAAGRVFLAPHLPFGFVDAPPSVNRLAGLLWLLHVLYPQQAGGGLDAEISAFYRLFYGVYLDAAQMRRLMGRPDR